MGDRMAQLLKQDRNDIVKFGMPLPPTAAVTASSSSSSLLPMSYVASLNFASLSDCNVVMVKKTKKDKNKSKMNSLLSNIKNTNGTTSTATDNNENTNTKKKNKKVGRSIFKLMFGGDKNNEDVEKLKNGSSIPK